MKKILILLTGLAVAAISCTKEASVDTQEFVAKKKSITVRTSIETRTVLSEDHNSLLWAEGDNFRLFTNADGYDPQTLTYSQGGAFNAEVTATATVAYAYYFAGTFALKDPTSCSTYINSEQTQSQAGVLNGQLLPMVAKGTINPDNTVSLNFHQLAGVLALNIYNADKIEGETIKSVLVTPTANTKFVGQSILDITQDGVIYTEGAEKYTTVNVELTTPYDFPTTKPASKKMGDGQIYVVLAKQNYTTLDFTITTSEGVYTITGTNFDLTSNDFLPVNINLAKAKFEEPFAPEKYTWNLVKDAISIGDKVIIAANASNKALSITQQSNNRKGTDISKSENVLTATSDVQAFEVVAGTTSGSIAFKALNGDTAGQYIYAASSNSNYLRTEETLDANGSWIVSFASSGAATVTAQGSNSRKVLQYNNASDIFACYASASQASVAIYKQGEVANPDAKVILSSGDQEVSPIGGVYSISGAYTTQNIDENTETLNVTSSENITDVTILDGDIEFSMEPNYTKNSQSGTITITLASDETVTATINVKQSGSTLSVSTTEVIIPANATEITFTVTSPDFGWTIVADDDTNIAFDESGEASATASTVTVLSDVEAGEAVQTIATLTVSRTENDPQAKTIIVKKDATSENEIYYKKVSLITSGKRYLIVGGTTSKVLVPTTGSNRKSSADVTITSNGILSSTTIDGYAVTINENGTNYDITFESGGTVYYLTYGSSTNLATYTSTEKNWTVSEGEYGAFRFVDSETTGRGLIFRGKTSNQFGGYAVSNLDGTEYYDIDLYEYQGE